MANLRMALISFLWSFPSVWRRWCWADAVGWAFGMRGNIGRADHTCFYCMACNTLMEIDMYMARSTMMVGKSRRDKEE